MAYIHYPAEFTTHFDVLSTVARLNVNRAQAKALKATNVFFRFNNSDDDDDDDEDDDHLGDSDHDGREIEENKDPLDSTEEGYGVAKYRFFVKVFVDDSEFRDYYLKNYQNGGFMRLVCGGNGMKKATKRFKDCGTYLAFNFN